MGLQIFCNSERGVEKGRGVGSGWEVWFASLSNKTELRVCHIFRLHIYGPHM